MEYQTTCRPFSRIVALEINQTNARKLVHKCQQKRVGDSIGQKSIHTEGYLGSCRYLFI